MEKSRHKSWLRVFAWKLTKSIGIALFIIICAKVGAFFATGGKGKQAIPSIAVLLIFAELGVIWKPTGSKLKVNCPKCGRWLSGVTKEMIGDIGVCTKCKAEFVIGKDDAEVKKCGWQ